MASPTSTPPLTPSHLKELLSLTQQLTPSKSPRTLRKLRQQLQVQANDAQQEQLTLKRRAVEAEQQVDTNRKPRKMRKRGHRDSDSRCGPLVRHSARDLLVEADVLNTAEDEAFNMDCEYDSNANEYKPWVQDSFLDGLHAQRAFISHRLRTEALHVIVDDVKEFTTSASRFDNFSKLIGYKPATNTSAAFYDRFAVPILYDEWDGKVDLNHIFRGPLLLKVFVSIIRGPRGAEGLFEGKSKLPQARCLERIHKIKRTSAGAIVNSAILAIWLSSADTQLLQVGDETTIDYGLRQRVYLRRIREGLRDNKAWAISLFDYWDGILFPNADKSRDQGAVGDERLEDDEELDDIFAQAPSAAERTGLQVPSSPRDDDDDHDDEQPRPASPSPPPGALDPLPALGALDPDLPGASASTLPTRIGSAIDLFGCCAPYTAYTCFFGTTPGSSALNIITNSQRVESNPEL
ncbi:hypothetical protein C8R44DRAFT_885273 [Mycena epipterygia]|nr:hypothetical protein C8R44DRAFT_885273 [Mycena epipterygia]